MAITETQERRQRARADTKSLTDWKIDVARGLVAALITVGVIALVGLPNDDALPQVITVAVFVLSVILVLGAEYAWNYVLADGRLAMDEAARLREENDDLRANREEVESIRQLQQQQAQLYKEHLAELQKKVAVSEAQFKVFQGVAEEERKTGQSVPLAAQLARLEVATQFATGDFSDKKQK